MNEPKPFAALSSGLLARKGQARPAMRPQIAAGIEDLGWNDMGTDLGDATAEAAAAAPRHEAIAVAAPAFRPQRCAKAAFTLRLNAERHLKLRVACALRHRSAQKIVTEALDAYLKTLPDLEAMAESLAATAERRTKRGNDA